jgi:hypothetical protein
VADIDPEASASSTYGPRTSVAVGVHVTLPGPPGIDASWFAQAVVAEAASAATALDGLAVQPAKAGVTPDSVTAAATIAPIPVAPAADPAKAKRRRDRGRASATRAAMRSTAAGSTRAARWRRLTATSELSVSLVMSVPFYVKLNWKRAR